MARQRAALRNLPCVGRSARFKSSCINSSYGLFPYSDCSNPCVPLGASARAEETTRRRRAPSRRAFAAEAQGIGDSEWAQRAFLRLFDRLDVNGDESVVQGELHVGLDLVLRSAPPRQRLLASTLLRAAGDNAEAKDLVIKKQDWVRSCADMTSRIALVPQNRESGDSTERQWLHHLHQAVDTLDVGRVCRLARRREAALGSDLAGFEQPRAEKFEPKQIDSMSSRQLQSVGLRRFEPCPEGYSFVSHVGTGMFGQVFMVQSEATQDVQAMKRIDRVRLQKVYGLSEPEVAKAIEHEFRYMQQTNHPHIVRLVEFRQDMQYAYFIMEAANGGDLMQLVQRTYGKQDSRPAAKRDVGAPKRLSEAFVANVLRQVLLALRHLHGDHKIHKDIKLENLMLLDANKQPHVVLIDLGLMENVRADDETGPFPAGTPHTIAPEVISTSLGKRSQGFDELCDIYSLGVVAFEMLVGKPPYQPAYKPGTAREVDYAGTLARIESVDLSPLSDEAGRSSDCVDMIKQMMAVDPSERPSALECLHHRWLKKHAERRRLKNLKADGRKAMDSLGAAPTLGLEEVEAGEEALQVWREEVASQMRAHSLKILSQRAVVYHLVAQMPMRNLLRLKESFDFIDKNQSGELEYEEIVAELTEVLGLEETEAFLTAEALDLNGSGAIDFTEFVAGFVSLSPERAAEYWGWAFEALEAAADKSGKLNIAEAHAVLTQDSRGRFKEEAVLGAWLQESTAKLQDLEGKVSVEALKRCMSQVFPADRAE